MDAAITFDAVSKIFGSNIDVSRTYAIRDMLRAGRRAPVLRPGEFFSLRNLSFQLPRQQAMLILGTPGSGKSTIAKLIAGLLVPDAGRVAVDGRVQLVQGGKLSGNPFMTLDEALELTVAMQGVPPARNPEARERLLTLCGLQHVAGDHLADVPRAYQRLLAFAAALLADADIFVFDDNLVIGEGTVREQLLARVSEIFGTRTTLVTAGGLVKLPAEVQHALVLHEGEAILYGAPKVILPIYTEFAADLQQGSRIGLGRGSRAAGGAVGARWTPLFASAGGGPSTTTTRVVNQVTSTRPVVMSPLVVDDLFARLRESRRPVVAGPWLADAALEILYWIPFLGWARRQLGADQPITALSRGGLDRWYAGAGVGYVDLYDLITPAEFDRRNQDRVQRVGSQKQLVVSDFEREILGQVAPEAVDAGNVLHPSLMNRVWAETWRGRLPPSFVTRLARYTPPALDSGGRVPGLPARYLAVKFEYSVYFPESPETFAIEDRLIQELSRRVPVVLLNTGHNFGNYRDGRVHTGPQVLALPETGGARHHLDLQTRALAGARAFVGTYGGVSYMAPFCGVDAFALYADPAGFFGTHAGVLRAAAESLGKTVYVSAQADGVAVDEVVRWALGSRGRSPLAWLWRAQGVRRRA